MDDKEQQALLATFTRTKLLIETAIRAEPNRYALLLPPANVCVCWGAPDAVVVPTSVGFAWTLHVRADWLHTVYEAGIALVDGFFVLYAQPSPRRVECDAAWLACVVVPTDSAGRIEVEVRNTVVVRWQGQIHCGKDQAQAMRQCQQDYTDALLINEEGDSII